MEMTRNEAYSIVAVRTSSKPNTIDECVRAPIAPHGPIIFRANVVFLVCFRVLYAAQNICAVRVKWNGMKRSEIFTFNKIQFAVAFNCQPIALLDMLRMFPVTIAVLWVGPTQKRSSEGIFSDAMCFVAFASAVIVAPSHAFCGFEWHMEWV